MVPPVAPLTEAHLSIDRTGKRRASVISLETEEEHPLRPLEAAHPFDDPVELHPHPERYAFEHADTAGGQGAFAGGDLEVAGV